MTTAKLENLTREPFFLVTHYSHPSYLAYGKACEPFGALVNATNTVY